MRCRCADRGASRARARPALLESASEACFCHELRRCGEAFNGSGRLGSTTRARIVDGGNRVDAMVEGRIERRLKAIERATHGAIHADVAGSSVMALVQPGWYGVYCSNLAGVCGSCEIAVVFFLSCLRFPLSPSAPPSAAAESRTDHSRASSGGPQGPGAARGSVLRAAAAEGEDRAARTPSAAETRRTAFLWGMLVAPQARRRPRGSRCTSSSCSMRRGA